MPNARTWYTPGTKEMEVEGGGGGQADWAGIWNALTAARLGGSRPGRNLNPATPAIQKSYGRSVRSGGRFSYGGGQPKTLDYFTRMAPSGSSRELDWFSMTPDEAAKIKQSAPLWFQG